MWQWWGKMLMLTTLKSFITFLSTLSDSSWGASTWKIQLHTGTLSSTWKCLVSTWKYLVSTWMYLEVLGVYHVLNTFLDVGCYKLCHINAHCVLPNHTRSQLHNWCCRVRALSTISAFTLTFQDNQLNVFDMILSKNQI